MWCFASCTVTCHGVTHRDTYTLNVELGIIRRYMFQFGNSDQLQMPTSPAVFASGLEARLQRPTSPAVPAPELEARLKTPTSPAVSTPAPELEARLQIASQPGTQPIGRPAMDQSN